MPLRHAGTFHRLPLRVTSGLLVCVCSTRPFCAVAFDPEKFLPDCLNPGSPFPPLLLHCCSSSPHDAGGGPDSLLPEGRSTEPHGVHTILPCCVFSTRPPLVAAKTAHRLLLSLPPSTVAALAVAALAATALAKDHKGSTKRAQKQHALHRHFSKLDIYNQQNDAAALPTTAAVDPRCPVGSLAHSEPGFENICAWRASPATNWGQGEALCQQEGGHMASFKNKEEFFFIQSLMGFQGEPYWVGLHKMDNVGNSKGSWVFTDGANPEYSRTQWVPGQPDNANGKEACAEIVFWNNVAQLNDNNCGAERPYLCIKQVPPADGAGSSGGASEADDGDVVAIVNE